MGGDIVASFFKRRIDFKSGRSLPPLDQLDFVIGYLILTSTVISVDYLVIINCLIITLIIHPLTNVIAYALRLKKVWW
jgi:CDP-2,3-bis-(O-geranylgeranyl)-sn-glycerol synthase